jgi:hypothetical protein
MKTLSCKRELILIEKEEYCKEWNQELRGQSGHSHRLTHKNQK